MCEIVFLGCPPNADSSNQSRNRVGLYGQSDGSISSEVHQCHRCVSSFRGEALVTAASAINHVVST